MEQSAHFTCAFPDGALSIADRLGDIARDYRLAAWISERGDGEWQIRIEGDPEQLRRFAADVGFRDFKAVTGT